MSDRNYMPPLTTQPFAGGDCVPKSDSCPSIQRATATQVCKGGEANLSTIKP